jgi:hypothetical protein
VATGDQYINLYASSYHGPKNEEMKEQMKKRQQELEELKEKIKLDKDVYNLFTNYHYYKILFQNLNLGYFLVVIRRIDEILKYCEPTTSAIILMNKALIESNFIKFQEIQQKNPEIFDGMIDEKYDLYLSAGDKDNKPLMDENGQQIIIKKYDEYVDYVEKGGIVLYTERFEELAGICKSAHDIYMDIIDKLPLFFEIQVTEE